MHSYYQHYILPSPPLLCIHPLLPPLHTHTHTPYMLRPCHTYCLVGSIVPQYVLRQVTIIAVRGIDTLEPEVIWGEWDVIACVGISLIPCDIETPVAPVCKDQL